MFNRYTQSARQAIFFARYETAQLGGPFIETEHLLLGVLRADHELAKRLLKKTGAFEDLRKRVQEQFSRPEKSSATDLPLSRESKRVLAHGAQEADRMHHEQIKPGHLLLGMLKEADCAGRKLLLAAGATALELEEAASDSGEAPPRPVLAMPPPTGFRDLTAKARDGVLGPLIGRERELESIIWILCRRTRNNAVLVGESGVGKNTIIEGLARRIAAGDAPANLADRQLLAADASQLTGVKPAGRIPGDAIVYVRGLFDLASRGSDRSVLEAMSVLEPHLAGGGQCIATGSPMGLRLTIERHEGLASRFEVVSVLPPKEDEAILIVQAVKGQFEKFHSVIVTDDAAAAAVTVSRWFLRHRQLPDRAIDLMDDAATRVRLRREASPPEPPANVVTAQDVVEAAAARAGVPPSAVERLMQTNDVVLLEQVARELAKQLPAEGQQWIDSLTAYLAGCSVEDAEGLIRAIRDAKARFDTSRG